jgi:hypothetical protein
MCLNDAFSQIDADQFRKQRGLILRSMAQGRPCDPWKRLAFLACRARMKALNAGLALVGFTKGCTFAWESIRGHSSHAFGVVVCALCPLRCWRVFVVDLVAWRIGVVAQNA